jgi:tRNA-Thr(GGU) m(6)t(6)A37 methyltransferase TsaA
MGGLFGRTQAKNVVVCLALYWTKRLLHSLRRDLRETKALVEKLTDLKQSERSGRIQAEKELRQLRLKLNAAVKHSSSSNAQDSELDADQPGSDGHSFIPIGQVRTCFPKRNGTPRQPHLVPAARGVLTLKAELPKDILSGLEQYSHCWLIYVFHQNTDLHQDWKKIKGKVNVPRLNGGRVGVLATRSPHRPNAIGLSSAKIDGISSNGKVLELSGVDLVDESPILDIKPYVPFCDSLSCAETPEWVRRDRDKGLEPLHIAEVSISDEVKEKLEACWLSNNEEEKRRSRRGEGRETYLALFPENIL